MELVSVLGKWFLFQGTSFDFNEFVSFVKLQEFDYQIEGENELSAFISTAKNSELPKSIIKSGEELLANLNELKEDDIINHRSEIKKILLTELAEKYYGNKDKIRYSLKNDDQLHAAIEVVLDEGEYKKILAIK